MKRLLFILIYATAWSALIAGSLQLSRLPIAEDHNFCGPWGCLPQPNALLSVHAFWASLIVPAAVLIVWASNHARIRLIWTSAFFVSLFILVGFVGHDAWNFVSNFDGETHQLWRRAVFRIVTATDFPVSQFTAACALNWLLCRTIFLHNDKAAV